MDDANQQIRELSDSFKAQLFDFKQQKQAGPSDDLNKEIKAYYEELNKNKAARNKIYNGINKIQAQIDSKLSEIAKAEKKISKTAKTEEEINREIQALDHKLNITTTDAAGEREIIRQKKFLKESMGFILQKEELKLEISQLREEKRKVGDGLDELKAESKSIIAEIDSLKKERDQATRGQDS